MKVPLGWLATFVDLPAQAELEERLALAGLEIEEVLRTGPDLSAIRVGHVLERRATRMRTGSPSAASISAGCARQHRVQGAEVAAGRRSPVGFGIRSRRHEAQEIKIRGSLGRHLLRA
jgi:hypothetical protein